MFAERNHDWRHDVRARDWPVLQHLQEHFEIELRHRDDRRRAHEAMHQDDHHPVDVKERQHAEQRRHLDVFDRLDLIQLRDDVAMGEHHALRQAGRPGRVGQHHEIVGRIDLHRRRILVDHDGRERRQPRHLVDRDQLDRFFRFRDRRLRLVREARDREENRDAAIGQLERQLFGSADGVRGVHDRAKRHHAEEHDRPLGHVGRPERHDVALLDAPGGQSGRGAANLVEQGSVGNCPPGQAVGHRDGVGSGGGVTEHLFHQVDVGDLDIRKGTAIRHGEREL